MGLGVGGRVRLDDQAGGHEPRDHPIERARLRRQPAVGLQLDALLDGVPVERAAGQREENVVLEEAHGRHIYAFGTIGARSRSSA